MHASIVARRQRRSGLTLIELLVVLVILIALAGVLVPLLPSMLTRAHTATCATNMGDVARAIGEYDVLYQSYGYNYDALSDGTKLIPYLAGGAALPAPYTGQGAGPGNNEVTGITLTATEAANLTGTGIVTVQSMQTGVTLASPTFDPTFTYYNTPGNPTADALPVAAGLVVGGLDPTTGTAAAPTPAYTRCIALNLPVTGRYVCLGIGPRCSLVGKIMLTPPVHFGDQPALNPEYGYERLVAIFKVSDTAASSFTQAQLVGVAPIHDTGLGSIQDELQNYYQLTNGGS